MTFAKHFWTASIGILLIISGVIRASDGGSRSSDSSDSPLAASLHPEPNATDVLPDTRLRIRFDAKPTINSGAVEIYDAATDKLVDSIEVQGTDDSIGYAGQANARKLHINPANIIGEDEKTISINLHTNALSLGKTYYVLVGDGVFSGTRDGQPFRGVQKGDWKFSTTATGFKGGTTIIVDDDAPADFASIQGALNYVMQSPEVAMPTAIHVRNGIYPEALFLSKKNNVTIKGESREKTLIQFKNCNGMNGGPEGRPLFLILDCDLITFENLTVHNTHLRSERAGDQAEAIYFASKDKRFIAKNSNFISEQDTILADGYVWFYNTLIAGNVDFIWGGAKVALIENSEIRSLGDSFQPEAGKGGFIVQSRVRKEEDLGYIFLNCTFTRGPGPTGNTIPDGATGLARTGNKASRSSFYYDSIAFINCKMDKHISPLGFIVEEGRMRYPEASTARTGYREFSTTDLEGKPLDLSKRSGAYLMSARDVAENYADRARIFSGYGKGAGWSPAP